MDSMMAGVEKTCMLCNALISKYIVTCLLVNVTMSDLITTPSCMLCHNDQCRIDAPSWIDTLYRQ